MGVKYLVEVPGLQAAIEPHLKALVGTDRIRKLRFALSRAANRMKYYIKKEFNKHKRSGLLASVLKYRVKYYRNTDTMVAIIGVESNKKRTYKGRELVSHKYAHFLATGHKAFIQKLRQPPFAPRVLPDSAPKKFSRRVGAQPKYINFQSIVNANINTIINAAVVGAQKEL